MSEYLTQPIDSAAQPFGATTRPVGADSLSRAEANPSPDGAGTTDVAQPKVMVMTLNWNNGTDLLNCVEALGRLAYPRYEILVVDNGSTDGSVARLEAASALARVPAQSSPKVRIIRNDRNLGYAEGMNVGLAAAFAPQRGSEAGAAYCLVINADTIIDPEALSELVRVAESDPAIGLVTGKVYWYSRPDVLQTAGRHSDPMMLQGPHVGSGEVDRGQWDEVRDYDYVDDVYLLVRREVFEQVGGYSPLFPVYWGISDLCARVRRAGWRIVYAPGSKVWHKGVIGNENVELSANRVYYLQNHQVLFMRRNATPQQWRAYVWRTGVSLPRQVLRYVYHRDFAKLWAHLRGLGSGMVWLARNRRRPSRGSRA